MTNKATVLIIDDSLVNLIFLQDILKKHSFNVVSANNGKRGLQLAQQSPPDIILLDIIMPGWDGYETCRRFKLDQKLSNIPILFLSALGELESKVKALQVGGVDYVNKPFQQPELLARLETHLELAHLRKNLECEVATQTKKIKLLFDALQLSYERAQQTSILKTEFLRKISHEFLTPMNIIVGMAEILIEDTVLTKEQQHYAQTIIKASKQLNEILTNMLNFAQQFKGEIKQVITEFQPYEIIDLLLKEFSTTAKSKSLQINTDIENSLLYMPLQGNKQGIYNVLNKFLDNAIKFTEHGKILIHIKLLSVKDNKQWILFEISDTGIGIPPEKKDHLFEIFSQVDNSSTRPHEGMGMGLAVAKMLTENMNGEIGMKSVLCEGSCFWIKIPLQIVKVK
jgi:two-component system sensor histidine kinase/response regulator